MAKPGKDLHQASEIVLRRQQNMLSEANAFMRLMRQLMMLDMIDCGPIASSGMYFQPSPR